MKGGDFIYQIDRLMFEGCNIDYINPYIERIGTKSPCNLN